mgnify:CR=1 FL=1|jgi:copper resistance protein B
MKAPSTSSARALLACALTLALAPAWAQDHSHHQMPPPEPATTTHDHAATHDTSQPPPVDHAAMGHGMPAPAQNAEPREAIPPITDADRAAAFPELGHGMQHAPERNSFVMFDRLEAVDLDHGRGEAWEAQAWFGSDLNRLWLRSEGERERGRTEAADLEVLYGRSVTPWWDLVTGLKHDFKPGDSRDWAAIGVQGLAPYKFEVSATAYVGESGATAATVEAEYEVLLTNRLILQPRVEIEAFGKDDPARGLGSGLSTAEAGLRLRYEFTRRFAPYVGVAWERAYGGTADHRRGEGEAVEDTRLVAGLRLWF